MWKYQPAESQNDLMQRQMSFVFYVIIFFYLIRFKMKIQIARVPTRAKHFFLGTS